MKIIFLIIISIIMHLNFTNPAMLTIKFENLKDAYIGKDLYVAYWPALQAGFPDASEVEIGDIIPITSKSMSIKKKLEDGEYAVSIFIDLNGNGKLDKNFFGMPKEPFCFSNNFEPKFAPPKFEDCSFKLEKDLIMTLTLID